MHKHTLYIRLLCFLMVGLSASCKLKVKTVEKVDEQVNYAEMVYPQLDTENSRWFFFSSASRPFGMVNLSPDTEIDGAWGSGYRYKTDTVQGFSHIHAWQMSGVSVMPVTLTSSNQNTIFRDFSSPFSHQTERIKPGFHYLELDRYQVAASLTSTTRVGLHHYRFPDDSRAAVLFNLNTMLGPCENINGKLQKEDNRTLAGQVVMKPTMRRPKPLTIFFKVKLSTDIASVDRDPTTGNYLVSLTNDSEPVLMKVGISYTSLANADLNIQQEMPHWDFDAVVADAQKEWNGHLGRIKVEGGTRIAQRRFYTDLWHALQGRRIISDVNGAYPDNTGEDFRVGQLPLDESGKPKFNHFNSDSFWGAQWTISTLWGLVYPEIKAQFVHSLLQYQKDGGLVPRGPSGGNYTYVMTGASSTPFVVSAIQEGIITEDLESIYEALKINHMPGGIMEKSGYEHNTQLGGGLKYYVEKGYVPYPIPEGKFGGHQDGGSLTLEYAYQDWTLAQLAKKLGYEEDYQYFLQRSENYKNVYDATSGWIRPKNLAGNWLKDFDPYQYKVGFVEANGAQATWFVPHDLEGLAALMGGPEKAAQKLHAQFEEAEKLGFTAGTSHDVEEHPEYRRIPINYGNQPSIQTGYVFHKLGRPDLTQYWSRQVIQQTFSGLSPATGYNGDEDQGLMGSLAVLMKMGLFQINGGTDEDPEYLIGSPVFDKISITLHPDYHSGETFVIEARDNSNENVYVASLQLNEEPLVGPVIQHSALTSGGYLELQMTDQPTIDNNSNDNDL
ncbi:GH92 family glycosyl hydrolase [Marinoscillum furvescens]|uniref:Putative alpha-1,2-mannosidase n=1 Tax=Marinoscillum furvescens DSM 4134 TaxID=1122208 RepID=A0A3D9KYG6_MARFU|nr:GH92 family glycosyl hydrolase [Marinoscillum furvescens]RED94638.1 putative alpha-1,2-mannosidase [Marinoscillum furvescens DSM 4134]